MKLTRKLKIRILNVLNGKIKKAVSNELITESFALVTITVFKHVILNSEDTKDVLKVIITLTGCLDYESYQILLDLLSEDSVILESMKRTIDYSIINEES